MAGPGVPLSSGGPRRARELPLWQHGQEVPASFCMCGGSLGRCRLMRHPVAPDPPSLFYVLSYLSPYCLDLMKNDVMDYYMALCLTLGQLRHSAFNIFVHCPVNRIIDYHRQGMFFRALFGK